MGHIAHKDALDPVIALFAATLTPPGAKTPVYQPKWDGYRAVYSAVEEERMPAEPDFPTFADGHEEILLGEAVARSAAEERWIQVQR